MKFWIFTHFWLWAGSTEGRTIGVCCPIVQDGWTEQSKQRRDRISWVVSIEPKIPICPNILSEQSEHGTCRTLYFEWTVGRSNSPSTKNFENFWTLRTPTSPILVDPSDEPLISQSEESNNYRNFRLTYDFDLKKSENSKFKSSRWPNDLSSSSFRWFLNNDVMMI